MFSKQSPYYKIEHSFLSNYCAFKIAPKEPTQFLPRIFLATNYEHLISNLPSSVGEIISIEKIDLPITIVEHAAITKYLRDIDSINK